MSRCQVCLKTNTFQILKTIGDQIVCSLSCVGLLKSNSKDSCDCCKRPVWKDNYFKINNKYYCSEICKNKIIKKLNIPYDSKTIQHIQDNIFSDNNDNIVLKNSKQLREEVLKFYKDFQFDTINDDSNNNIIAISNNNSFNKKEYKNKITIKEKKYKKSNIKLNIITNFDNTKSKNSKEQNTSVPITTNNRNNRKYILNKAFTALNLQKDKNALKNKTKNLNKEQKSLNNNYNYNSNYNTSNNNNYLEISNHKENEHSEKNLSNNINSYNSNDTKNYSFINNSESKNNKYKTLNINNSNVNKNFYNYISLTKNSKSPVVTTSNQKECISCGTILGNAKILDRNRNAFCSDYCKEYYLKYYG